MLSRTVKRLALIKLNILTLIFLVLAIYDLIQIPRPRRLLPPPPLPSRGHSRRSHQDQQEPRRGQRGTEKDALNINNN